LKSSFPAANSAGPSRARDEVGEYREKESVSDKRDVIMDRVRTGMNSDASRIGFHRGNFVERNYRAPFSSPQRMQTFVFTVYLYVYIFLEKCAACIIPSHNPFIVFSPYSSSPTPSSSSTAGSLLSCTFTFLNCSQNSKDH
jgi:hypothetical protein